MGVNGLLQVLKEIQDPGSLERYRGKTLAIDTYGWLHRAIVSCSQELCLGQPTRNYITYVLTKIRMLQDFNITPYFVFDGASLPTKQETNKERQQRRQEAKELAEKHLAENNPRLAEKQYMKAAYVTSQMSKSIMCELDMMGINYVVAPYEADPQMVYLEKIGLVDGILSEDSDLLIFGCKMLITKLKDDATCYEIKRENFANVRKIPYLNQYTDEQLRLVAMLSGCDYTKGIPGVGLTKAFQMVRRYKMLEKVLIALRSTGKVAPPNFREEVELANLAFQFQKVFDPRTQQVTTLNDYPEGVELDQEVLERCCGRTLNQEIYRKLCNGEIHPNTHEILVSREQSLPLLQYKSMYSPKSRNKVRSPRRAGISAGIAHRSRSEGALPQTAKPSNSVLDLLRVTKRTLHPQTPKTPERVIKRPRVVYGTKEVRLSPTDRKIQKLSAPSPKGLISKFFKPKSKAVPVLPTPCSEPTAPVWNSSLAEDSDVPEGSSPEKPVDTRNVLAELTDNDEEPTKEMSQEIHSSPTKDPSIHSSPTKEGSIHSSPNKFDVYSNDDVIEESPVKNLGQPQLQTKLVALRETFLYHSNTTVKLTRKSYPLNGSPKKRMPLQSKSVNLPIRRSPVKFPRKSKSLKQIDASPEGDDRIKSPPQNESPTKPRKRIDLRQFAYSVK
ncbi:Exodeoxyribonuclease 1 [Candida viswanathii]|uniref:Exodeoxyribonuclease 1 n=1 Tax=Candida viswanathii TaxID=5486 RepID=A0A367YGR1_9ASCO|nr:Exodeoxyribonuclease 1 [Candida viswanathii]